jgi:hypothetical protein
MPIPTAYMNRFIYHFTHIDNLPALLKTGFLANNHPDFPACGHHSVAERGIQCRRAEMPVTCGPGGVVHDYVPLYFGSVSLMLLGVINKKNVDQMDILYFEFPIALVSRDDVVFTDASANTKPPPNFYSDPVELGKLNWAEIDSLKWKSASDALRHQRMAEVLVHAHLPLQSAQRVVVWNEMIKERVQAHVSAAGVHFPAIEFESRNRRHWFNNFMEGSGSSVVVGPRQIARHYLSACKVIREEAGKKEGAPFETPKNLLESLRKNFACLPHTAELVGLKSENFIHTQTVEKHTLEVIAKLKSLDIFKFLSSGDQSRTELAAYLHDIGKGPKSRWTGNGGIQKVDPDHPFRAISMVLEIFIEQVKNVKQEDAELILKLVCYHDLVGDVLGRGRDEQQIIDVANNERELKMLFALGKADATSLVACWWDEAQSVALFTRCLAAISARALV